MRTVKIGKKLVGDGYPCYILAEAGCNHNQDLEIAKRLVDMAALSKADGIKFQTYRAENIYSKKTPMMSHFKQRMNAGKGATMYDLIKKTELSWSMHRPIVEYCRKKKVVFLSTPFEEKAVDFLQTFRVPAYKIASFEMTHFPLIRRVARTGKPVILSTGMSSLGDIEKVVSIIQAEGNDSIILLHCVSNYPAKAEDSNLRVLNTLKSAFGFPVGLSDHTPGIEISKIAMAVGANLIEKHITTDQALPGPDHYFSLTIEELRELVKARDFIESVLGSPYKRCADNEKPMKHMGRRSLIAARDIAGGSCVRADMIAVKRPGYGLHPELMENVIGMVAIKDIEEDEPLSWDMFVRYKNKKDVKKSR